MIEVVDADELTELSKDAAWHAASDIGHRCGEDGESPDDRLVRLDDDVAASGAYKAAESAACVATGDYMVVWQAAYDAAHAKLVDHYETVTA